MATRIVEWKKPYTWGQAIEVTEDKVINLKLRAENNLIIYDHWDDEIYVDLQLSDEIEPTDAFPVWVNTGRVIVDNGWDKTGTIICAKTTSWDNIKLLYADDGTLWVDNGTGTFKQIYLKGDIDTIVSTLTDYIDAHDTVVSDTAPSDPYEWQLWYDTTNDALKVYDGSQWTTTWGWGGSWDVVWPASATDWHLAVFDWATWKLIKDWGAVPTWDVEVSTQANNIFSSWMKIWWGTQANYESLTPDSNTAYLIVASQPTPPSPWRQPWANTIAYYPLDSANTVGDLSGNNYTLINDWGISFWTYNWVDCCYINSWMLSSQITSVSRNALTYNIWYCEESAPTYDNGSLISMSYADPRSSWGFFTGVVRAKGRPSWAYWIAWAIAIPWSDAGSTASSVTANTWYNICYTFDGSVWTLYVNWQLIGTVTESWSNDITYLNISRSMDLNRSIKWYVSEAIYEDKIWTQTEITNYFNDTKANYWIS